MKNIVWKVDHVRSTYEGPTDSKCALIEGAIVGMVVGPPSFNSLRDVGPAIEHALNNDVPKIKDVIFNPPATIVFWQDGTKTVVKDQGEEYFDPEKGLAMAISKKALGNKGNYYNQFAKWVGKYEVEPIYSEIPSINIPVAHELKKAFEKIVDRRIDYLTNKMREETSNEN